MFAYPGGKYYAYIVGKDSVVTYGRQRQSERRKDESGKINRTLGDLAQIFGVSIKNVSRE